MIKDIIVGDRLADGAYVTGTFKASSINQEFYSINNNTNSNDLLTTYILNTQKNQNKNSWK